MTYSRKRGYFPLPIVQDYPDGVERPLTRGDCLPGGSNAARPCPFVSCRFHLAIDVPRNGSLKLNFPDQEVDAMVETCALDVADRGGVILEEVGTYMNLTRERIRQVLSEAMLHVQLGPGLDEWADHL